MILTLVRKSIQENFMMIMVIIWIIRSSNNKIKLDKKPSPKSGLIGGILANGNGGGLYQILIQIWIWMVGIGLCNLAGCKCTKVNQLFLKKNMKKWVLIGNLLKLLVKHAAKKHLLEFKRNFPWLNIGLQLFFA